MGMIYRVAASYQTTSAEYSEYLASLADQSWTRIVRRRALCSKAEIVHIPDIRDDLEYTLDLKKLERWRGIAPCLAFRCCGKERRSASLP